MKTFSIQDYYSIGGKEKALDGLVQCFDRIYNVALIVNMDIYELMKSRNYLNDISDRLNLMFLSKRYRSGVTFSGFWNLGPKITSDI